MGIFDLNNCCEFEQEKLFRVAGLPMVENCMSGYNSCMFAYGQVCLKAELSYSIGNYLGVELSFDIAMIYCRQEAGRHTL